MSISAESTDYINWAYLLKGNYRKGVHRLREIMGTPGQAQEFCSNAGAMALVLGHDPDHPDANSEQLRELILGSTYVDFAIEHWFPLVFPGHTAEEIVSDDTLLAAVMGGSTTAPALAESDKWLAKALASLVDFDSGGIDSIATLVTNGSAISAVVASSSAMAIVAESEKCLTAILENDDAAGKLFSSSVAVSALVASDKAVETIEGSPDATETFIAAIPSNASTLFPMLEKSDKLMKAAFDNDAARSALASVAQFASLVATTYASTFASESWATLAKIADVAKSNPSAFSSYQGKTRNVAITSNGTHSFEVAGVGMDGAGFTFICTDLVGTHRMNASNTTSGGWERCEMRSWLNGTLINNFPAELRNVIKSVSKKNTSGYGAATTSDKLWIPSWTEVGLTSGNAEGNKYGIFNSNSDRIRKNGGSATNWWLRSVDSSTYFRYVYTDGGLYYGNASIAHGVCPCFCI